MTQEDLKQIHTALSLLNSMVNGGEQHSKQSIEITQNALQIVKNLNIPDVIKSVCCAVNIRDCQGFFIDNNRDSRV